PIQDGSTRPLSAPPQYHTPLSSGNFSCPRHCSLLGFPHLQDERRPAEAASGQSIGGASAIFNRPENPVKRRRGFPLRGAPGTRHMAQPTAKSVTNPLSSSIRSRSGAVPGVDALVPSPSPVHIPCCKGRK